MPSAATIRWHRHEQRKRNGRVLVEIEADEVGLELLLKHHGRLSSRGAENHSELIIGLQELVELLIADVLKQPQG